MEQKVLGGGGVKITKRQLRRVIRETIRENLELLEDPVDLVDTMRSGIIDQMELNKEYTVEDILSAISKKTAGKYSGVGLDGMLSALKTLTDEGDLSLTTGKLESKDGVYKKQ